MFEAVHVGLLFINGGLGDWVCVKGEEDDLKAKESRNS